MSHTMKCPECDFSDEVITGLHVSRCNRCCAKFPTTPKPDMPTLVTSPSESGPPAPGWKPFYFESNQFFDWINGPDDFKRLCWTYWKESPAEILDRAKEATYNGHRPQADREALPKYGFRIECDGEPLRAFFDRHGMTIPE